MWIRLTEGQRNGDMFLVGYNQATVSLMRYALWDDGEDWELTGFDSLEEKRGWWSYDNCVGQGKLTFEPTHYFDAVDEVPEVREEKTDG